MRRAQLIHRLLVGALIVVVPGCLMGSPLAAISGEPYGMVIDDVKAIDGKRGRIWSNAPFFAVIDIPFAFVLDTALLPLSLTVWGIQALVGDDEKDEQEPRRSRSGYKKDRSGAASRAADSRGARE